LRAIGNGNFAVTWPAPAILVAFASTDLLNGQSRIYDLLTRGYPCRNNRAG
jgi:hypothetical protein